MSDLDLGVYQVCFKSMIPANWPSSYKIGFGIDYSSPSYPYVPGDFKYLTGPGSRYPILSIDDILTKIFSKQGYTLQSNIQSWKGMYLSISSADAEATPENLKLWEVVANTSTIVTGFPYNYLNWQITKNDDFLAQQQLSDGVPWLYYYKPIGGAMTIQVDLLDSYVSGGSLLVDIEVDGDVHTETFYGNRGRRTYTRDDITDDFPRVINVRARSSVGQTDQGCKITIGKTYTDVKPKNATAILNLSERTGFETQFDFMKFFAQTFGLTFVVNEITKNVYAFTLQLLYDNVKSGKVKDWSSKVDRNPKSTLNFTLDKYAQENIISLEENTQDGITDSGIFHIENKTLKFSKELFKIGVGSGQDVNINDIANSSIGAEIPLIKLTPPSYLEDGKLAPFSAYLNNASFPEIKPHLVKLSSTKSIIVYPSIWTTVGPVRYYVANHITAQQIVDTGYSILQDKMLKNARMVEDKFYLTPEDVEQFDPSIPVYIDKYGAYFYVNKIKNFELGRLTECQLVRL